MISCAQYSSVTGIILAGGKSARMGRDKALLGIGGEPFIKCIADVMKRIFEDVMIISNHGNRYAFLGLPIHGDVFENCGPLGGIHAGLIYARTSKVFVVSCDLPFIDTYIIQQLVSHGDNGDASLFSIGGYIQPLFGLYSSSSLETIERHLRNGQLSVLCCLKELDTCIHKLTSDSNSEDIFSLTNINTPTDYSRSLASQAYR